MPVQGVREARGEGDSRGVGGTSKKTCTCIAWLVCQKDGWSAEDRSGDL